MPPVAAHLQTRRACLNQPVGRAESLGRRHGRRRNLARKESLREGTDARRLQVTAINRQSPILPRTFNADHENHVIGVVIDQAQLFFGDLVVGGHRLFALSRDPIASIYSHPIEFGKPSVSTRRSSAQQHHGVFYCLET